MSGERSLAIALVGCGRVAERLHLPALARCPQTRLVALVDRDRGRLAAAMAIARRAGEEPARLTDPGELAGLAEAAIVATPPASHLELARALTTAGLRCLIEKPPGRDAADARALAALEPAVSFAFNRRFAWPGIAERLRALEPGFRIEGSFDGDLAAWGAHETAADALDELGSHLADLAMIALGDGVGARCERLAATGATFTLSGERGSASLRCDARSGWDERVVVRASSGKVIARWRAGGIRGRLAAALGRSRLSAAAAGQLRAFAAIGGAGGGLAGAAEGVRVMAALDAIRASAAAGGDPVEVAA